MSTWSKKTYNMVVTILAEELYWVPMIAVEKDNLRETLIKEAIMVGVQEVVQRFCLVFQQDNSRFDVQRFLDAFHERGNKTIDHIKEMETLKNRLDIENPSASFLERLEQLIEEVGGRWDIGNDVDKWPESYTDHEE